MINSEWIYYQHALIPALLPHEQGDALRKSALQSLHNSGGGGRKSFLPDGQAIMTAVIKPIGGIA